EGQPTGILATAKGGQRLMVGIVVALAALSRKMGAKVVGCSPCCEENGFDGAVPLGHIWGAKDQSGVGQFFEAAEQSDGIGTAFEAAAKYKLKVLPVVGVPNAEPTLPALMVMP